MSFSFNKVFKRAIEEDRTGAELENELNELNDLKEDIYHIQDMVNVGFWTHCTNEDKTFYSHEFYNIFELCDKNIENFTQLGMYFHPDDKEKVMENMKELINGREYLIEYRIITPKGSVKLIREKTRWIYDKSNNPLKIIGVIENITENIQLYGDILEDEAKCSGSRLKSKACFLQELNLISSNLQTNGEKYALLIMGVEGIKRIDSSLGEKLGNKIILRIEKKLKEIFLDNKSIYRYSEDQFAIIVKENQYNKNYESLAKDIIKIFAKPFRLNSYELLLYVNIGICIFPSDEEDSLPLRNRAKIALINSKKKGKNEYEIYSSKLNIEYYKEFTLRSDLFSCIEKEQLELYYQPIVNLKTDEILAVEVLIRWNHPEWGLVPSREFISIAEETGFVIDIGKWVLKEVCKNYRKWFRNSLTDAKVSVNFSSVQFMEKDFAKNIIEIIKSYYLDPKFLIMEIKENILIENRDKFIEDIKTLRAVGIQVALDDFGTGFSSISYLNSLSIDMIKLDKSFIKKIPIDKTTNIITKTAIKLAKDLKIKFTAEGIEDLEQLSYLKKINCVAGQGYIYSEVIPLEEIEEILIKKTCKPKVEGSYSRSKSRDRRKFFRIEFPKLLEGQLTILKIGNKDVSVGNTDILIKNIGPGGLCFISNIRFPIENKFLLKFTTNLIGKSMEFPGNPVWTEEIDENIYEYGVEFKLDKESREQLFKELSQVQLKMRGKILFDEGKFTDISYGEYFK